MSKTTVKLRDRFIAILLSIQMIFAMIPFTAFQVSAATPTYPNAFTVSVTDDTGAIADATVELKSADVAFASSATTGQDGVAAFLAEDLEKILTDNGIEVFHAEVHVRKDGYDNKVQSVDISKDSLTGNVDVVLSKTVVAPTTATVSVSVTGDATVEVNGLVQNAATVKVGTEVPVTITPAQGSYIKVLTVGGEVISVNKGEAYQGTIKADADIAISATVVKEFTVTAPAVDGGSITLNGSEVAQLTVDENSVVNVGVNAHQGYQISSVTIGGQVQTVNDATTFNAQVTVTSNTEIAVAFTKVYTVTVIHNGNGTVVTDPQSAGGSVTVENGTVVKITADPDDNYRISEVKINEVSDPTITGNNYGPADVYTKELTADKDYTVAITFAPNRYKVTAEKTTNGTVSIESDLVDHNGSTKVIIMPQAEYTIESAKVNGLDTPVITPDDTSAYLMIEGIVEDKKVVVTFKKTSIADINDVSFNHQDAIRANLDGMLYVFSKDAMVTFTTDKQGIRIYDTNGHKVGGGWTTKSVNISNTTAIGKISLYYKAAGEWIPNWHDITVINNQNPLNIVIDVTQAQTVFEPAEANIYGYYNSDVAVGISVEDKGSYSGIASVEYWITKDGIETKREPLYTYQAGNEVYNTYNKTITVSAADNNSDNVAVYVKVVDRAGNESISSTSLKINTTKPSISVAIDGTLHAEAAAGKYNTARTATVTYIDRATSFNEAAAMQGIQISAKDANGKDVPISKASMINWSHSGDTHIATIDFAVDANYVWNVSYTNKADLSDDVIDATGESIYEFAVDTTAPNGTISLDKSVWQKLVDKLTFELFKNHTVTAVASGWDNTTEIYDIVYYKSNQADALTEEQLDALFAEGAFTKETFTVSDDERFAVYARITDFAGNTKYISTNGVIYDKTESVITITLPQPNKHGYYNKNVVVGVYVNDAVNVDKSYSGIKSINYTIEKDGHKTKEENLYTFEIDHPTYDELKKDYSGEFTVNAKENNSDNVKVTVQVEDNAGNKYQKSVVLAISIDKPTAAIDFTDVPEKVVDGHGYYSQTRTATITVVDRANSFDEDEATAGIQFKAVDSNNKELTLTGDDVVIDKWSHDGDKHTTTVTFNKNGNYTWHFEYTNKADNVMQKITTDEEDCPYSFTVDTEEPRGSIAINTNVWDKLLEKLTFGLYSNVKAEITATAEDDTSPVVVEYFETENPIAMTAQQLDQQTFQPYQDYSISTDKQFVVYLKITDYAGNYTYISSDGYIVDKVSSNITLTPSPANGFYDSDANAMGQYGIYNKESEARVDIVVEDAKPYSGIKLVEYWVENNNTKTQEGNLFTFEVAEPEQKDLVEKWEGSIVVDKELNNSCDVVVYVRTVDNAGNEQVKSAQLDIDVTAPTIDVTFDNNSDNNGNTYFDAQRTATVVITERNHHFDANAATNGIVVTAVDANGNPVENAYVLSDWTSADEDAKNPDATTHTATIFFEKDANYTWSVDYTDKAGNANEGVNTADSVATFDFTVDTTCPTGTIKATSSEGRQVEWNELRDSLTFGFWSKEKITITNTSNDLTSAPIAAVEYYKVKANAATDATTALTAQDLDKVTGWNKFEGLEITSDEQFVVYLKITDLAGNYTYISTNGLIVDHTAPMEETIAPEITVNPQQPINGLYNGDVKVAIKVTDPLTGGTYSGLKTITYKVLNMGVETQTGTLYSFENTEPQQGDLLQTWTGEITVDSKLNNSNDVSIVIYAEDNALNGSEDKAEIKIDTTAPTIDVSYDNNSADNEKYFKANRTATIVVTERNFNKDDVKVTITNTDGVVPVVGNWTKAEGTGNQDDTKWTATVTYDADGDYTFDIAYTDLADNKCAGAQYGNSVAPREFTIDKTLPVIAVNYDNNNVANEKYFNAPRTATVTVTEHNFDVSRVKFEQTAALDGANIAIPGVSWSSNGDLHTATITFDKDGDYTFDVAVTDMASNENETVNYGNNAAAQDFVVDQTIAKPTIGGVENGSAYKEDVIPTIDFNDVNYDSSEITLVRTRMGEKNVDVTEEFIKSVSENAQGGSGSYDTFDKIVENDGIYTLTVKMTDKAGNEETEECTFTVNRFGSVYVYGDYLASLIKDGGQYVTIQGENDAAITQDIVITEYNADKLLEGSLKIMATRDGQTIDIDYTSDPAIIGETAQVGESGWYEYTYTIKAANFAEDGVYKLTLTSEYATVDSESNNSTSVPENSRNTKGEQVVDSIGFTVDTVAPEIRNIVNLEESIVNAQQLDVKYTIIDVGGLKSIEVIVNGEIIDTITEFGESVFNYSGQFTINEMNDAQTVQLKVTDLAGNVTDTAAEDFSTGDLYIFNDTVTVSTNAIVRWYANKPLFWGSIVGVVVLAGAIGFLITLKRKKKEKEVNQA